MHGRPVVSSSRARTRGKEDNQINPAFNEKGGEKKETRRKSVRKKGQVVLISGGGVVPMLFLPRFSMLLSTYLLQAGGLKRASTEGFRGGEVF